MDKAKAAISDFMGKAGKHDTTVHETVAPAVHHETVKPHHHEEINTVVDKEVHQDHYHRTVQPVQDREVLPEEHHTKLGAVQHREFDHREHDHTKRSLAAEEAAFRDERVVHDTTHSQSSAPVIGGEHVHHHIHEVIQPVVHKETIQPHVTHTTVPIHEVHHNTAQHHESSELPAMTMADFTAKGGVLGGRSERYDGFEGEPKHIGGLGGHGTGSLTEGRHTEGRHTEGHHTHGHHTHGTTSEGLTGTGTTSEGFTGTGTGVGAGHLREERAEGNKLSSYNERAQLGHTAEPKKKASLMDKLNPSVDSNGDGKAGFMK